MKRKSILIFLVALLFPVALHAEGDGHYKILAEKKAQQVIDKCWALSKTDRESGITSKMRSGALNSAQCIEAQIIKLSEDVLFPHDKKMRIEVKESLEKIKSGTGKLYWNLYNEHEACSQSPCGTINHPLHNAEVAHEMEKILKAFYGKMGEFDQYHQYLAQTP